MKKTISTYIITTNSLFWQASLEATIRQSLLFSDEIVVVNSELTTDGTQELLDGMKSEYPNEIKLYRYKENFNDSNHPHKMRWIAEKKTFALRKCKKDYCILQDDDECIHEKYAEYIKLLPEMCPDTIAFRFNVLHFYRSFSRYQNGDGWYKKKIYMIKNIPEIKHGLVGTDPDNHVIYDNIHQRHVPLDSLLSPKVIDTAVVDYHYGWSNRNDAILLMKKYFQEIQWWGEDYWKFNEFPIKFDNPDRLLEFDDKDGHPKYMTGIIEQERKFNSKHIKEFTL